MGQSAEGEPDRSAAIYAAVISALIAGGHTNFDPWPPVTYIDATARSNAGPVAVKDVVTRPIPVEVQRRIGAALAAHTEVRFVDDPQSVIQPDSRVRDHGLLITLVPVPPAGRPRHNRGTVVRREPRQEELRVHRGRGRLTMAGDRDHRCLLRVLNRFLSHYLVAQR